MNFSYYMTLFTTNNCFKGSQASFDVICDMWWVTKCSPRGEALEEAETTDC